MLYHMIIGALAVLAIGLLLNYAQKKNLALAWWHWLLTILGLVYTIFVLEVIYGFVAEGEPRAALVMGLITGIVAIIWGVLVARFIFAKKAV